MSNHLVNHSALGPARRPKAASQEHICDTDLTAAVVYGASAAWTQLGVPTRRSACGRRGVRGAADSMRLIAARIPSTSLFAHRAITHSIAFRLSGDAVATAVASAATNDR